MQSAEWLDEIYKAIEESDTFLTIMSPEAVASELWQWELIHANSNGKRIICVNLKDVRKELIPEEIERTISVDAKKGDVGAIASTIEKHLDFDIHNVKLHTKLLVEALEWTRADYDRWMLLSGAQLTKAMKWRDEKKYRKSPSVTPIQMHFVTSSIKGEIKIRRRLSAALLLLLCVAITLIFPSQSMLFFSVCVFQLVTVVLTGTGDGCSQSIKSSRSLEDA